MIDDSREYCDLLERLFRRLHPGTGVFVMADGQRAIEHLVHCGDRYPLPDLVLLDRVMPGGPDGMEVLRAVRALQHLDRLAVIVTSGSDDQRHFDEARHHGADGYIVKPVEQSQFPALVQQVVAWRPEDSWRNFGGAVSGSALAVRLDSLPSAAPAPMNATHPAVADARILHEENSFMRVYHVMRDLFQKTIDPVDLAINEACRKHHIPPGHARGRGKDYVTVQNRHRVILELMHEGFGDQTIEDNFLVSKRTIERLRDEWRRKGGGSLADRKN